MNIMNKKTDLEESSLTKVIDDISEGLNDAGTVFNSEETPVIEESTGKQAVRYLLWGLLSVVVNFGAFSVSNCSARGAVISR